MGFWSFCLAKGLLIPAIMLVFGQIFQRRPPRRINGLYGYRTARSMKNQATWDFAHRYCGKLWARLGLVLLPLSALVMLPVLGADTGAAGLWCGAVVLVQTAVLLGSIFPVERALKKEFDQFGKKR